MLSNACKNFGLTISTKKTEVMYQPAPGKPYRAPIITVNGHRLNAVDKFTYFGSTFSRDATPVDKIKNRLVKRALFLANSE